MVTRHSIERVYQRTGCNRRASARVIENAIERGKGMYDFREKEKKYLAQVASKNGNECMYYNGAIYIVTPEKVCVTVLIPPKWFGRKGIYSGKTRIRRPKKGVSYNLIKEEDRYYGFC